MNLTGKSWVKMAREMTHAQRFLFFKVQKQIIIKKNKVRLAHSKQIEIWSEKFMGFFHFLFSDMIFFPFGIIHWVLHFFWMNVMLKVRPKTTLHWFVYILHLGTFNLLQIFKKENNYRFNIFSHNLYSPEQVKIRGNCFCLWNNLCLENYQGLRLEGDTEDI
jgi:hypothetical protein